MGRPFYVVTLTVGRCTIAEPKSLHLGKPPPIKPVELRISSRKFEFLRNIYGLDFPNWLGLRMVVV